MIYLLLAIFNPGTLYIAYRIYAKTPKTSPFYLPVLVVGAIIDLVVNQVWFNFIFLDFKKGEWMLTKRVQRLKSDLGYRGKLALLICAILNKYQPGHC
jgi:hypothetical protein